MIALTPLTEIEVQQIVVAWYQKLDVHAPVADLLAMLGDEGIEMRFPEATLHTQAEFIQWYEGVTRKFFNETHTLKEVHQRVTPEQVEVQLVVNWQAHVWNAPEAQSRWLGFDAAQRWIVKRSPRTHRAVVTAYIVDALTPMPGSPAL